MSVTFLGRVMPGGISIPFYSSMVPAGFPSPAADHIEKHISLDEMFNIRAPHVYMARISGDSMQGAGIFADDIVIVDCSLEAVHGDIVIAALNCEDVCKRLYRRGGVVMLQSENPKYPPRYVLENDELLIHGVVTSSMRRYARA